jgi:hypothetical protein
VNLFNWLLLGHFFADWLLQSDWMAKGKRERFFSLPGIVHYTLYTAVIVLILYGFSWQLGTFHTTIPIGAIIFCSHWLIDGTNFVDAWMRFLHQRKQVMVYVVIDQTLHLLILGAIASWLAQ